MLTYERFKLFNDYDVFKKIYYESYEDFVKLGFLNATLSKKIENCLKSELCCIARDGEKVIGYELCFLNRRRIEGGFTYVSPAYRGRGVATELRKLMWQIVEEYSPGNIECFIEKGNFNSIRSIIKTAEIMGFKASHNGVVRSESGVLGYHYKITKA